MARRRRSQNRGTVRGRSGHLARSADVALESYTVGSLPLVNTVLDRMGLRECLEAYLPPSRPQVKVQPADVLTLLVQNILSCREPLYGVGEWARPYAPDLFGLTAREVAAINDDRVGRCLDRLFDADRQSMVLALVAHTIREFEVELDELHNDSTTVTLFGRYESARKPAVRRGKRTLAVTWGFNKDHRPDLKQLLLILTTSSDGGIPIHFTAADGNVTDDQTHRDTWDLLRQLTGRADFLYVADSKLATSSNMRYIDSQGGRFVTVLPKTRAEDKAFRQRLREQSVEWDQLIRKRGKRGEILDVIRVAREPGITREGYRLLWYHSSRKEELDQVARATRIERTLRDLKVLRGRLTSPRSRFKEQARVDQAVEKILSHRQTRGIVRVTVLERTRESYRQAGPGRPGPQTRYLRETKTRFDLHYEIDQAGAAEDSQTDGVFPLVTNDATLPPDEVYAAYKKQPLIEARHAQLKTGLHIAPVYLKSVSRVEALFCVFFLALLVESLVARELRKAMASAGIDSLPLYPEDRPCKAPCAQRLMEIFGNIQRHILNPKRGQKQVLTTQLSDFQKTILRLMRVAEKNYGAN